MVRSFFASSKTGGGTYGQVGECVNENVKAVLHHLRRKGPPLSAKQLDYCNDACIQRVLKAKGNNVKKATKQLRATLAWRAALDVDYLTADEFSAELAGGNAYVAGLDDHARPVLIVKLKPEITALREAQKQLIRYFVFTMEVAIACMTSEVEQCVLIVDAAACPKRSSIGFSIVVQLLRLLGEHYAERLGSCFIVDAPSVFHFLWKGISRVLDLKVREKPRFVSSKQYKPAGTSRPVSAVCAAAGHLMCAASSYSNQNFWTPSNEQISDEEEEVDREDDKFTLELSKTSKYSSASALSASSYHHCNGGTLLADKERGRSLSFALAPTSKVGLVSIFQSFRADSKLSRRLNEDGASRWADMAFSQRNDDFSYQSDNCTDVTNKRKSASLFRPYYVNHLLPDYMESAYRARMKPPLAGLISIISPDLKARQRSFTFHPTAMEAMLHHLHFD